MITMIIYISLAFSLFFTFLSLAFNFLFKYPNKLQKIYNLKNYQIFPKIIILSQLFSYDTLGTPHKYRKIINYGIIYGSTLMFFFGVWFRFNVLRHVDDYNLIFVICMLLMINLNTIFRSFVNFSKTIFLNDIFYKLLDSKFFENIKGSKWEQRIVYLIMFRKK